MRRSVVLLASVVTLSCSRGADIAPAIPAVEAPAAEAPAKKLPRDAVERAAVPFTPQTTRGTGEQPSLKQLLSAERVICVGERHPEPVDHYIQWQVIREMAELAARGGEPLAVGFEMFDRSQQSHLDRFANRQTSEEALVAESGYDERWGFDFDLYRPLLEEARDANATLLGLNAPRDWTRSVARQGLDGVAGELRAQFPELVLDDPEHREFFAAAMQGHPGHGAPPGTTASERPEATSHGTVPDELEWYYQAQVLWDETMADTAARWLTSAPRPGRLVIVAGNGHCHDSAIPNRIQRRTGIPVSSARAIRRTELQHEHVPDLTAYEVLLVIEDGPEGSLRHHPQPTVDPRGRCASAASSYERRWQRCRRAPAASRRWSLAAARSTR